MPVRGSTWNDHGKGRAAPSLLSNKIADETPTKKAHNMATIVAVFSELSDKTVPAGTADLAVTYLRQAHGVWIDAEAVVIKRGRQLCSVEVSVTNDEGVLCARGRVLYAMRSA